MTRRKDEKMGEVQWIKLYIDMFDRRKINKIRRLPAGNDILLFWVMLLATAGKCNAGGMIYITERVPFTKEDLADEFDFEISTIELALKAFVEFDMIDLYDDGFIEVKNWEKYQSVDKLAEIREKNRLSQQKSRAKKKLLQGVNDMSHDGHMTCHGCHDVEVDKEKDKDKDKEKEFITTTTTTQMHTGEGVDYLPPSLGEVGKYFLSISPDFDDVFAPKKYDAFKEAEKFCAYNAMRNWDCLPDWQKAADLWIARMDDKNK